MLGLVSAKPFVRHESGGTRKAKRLLASSFLREFRDSQSRILPCCCTSIFIDNASTCFILRRLPLSFGNVEVTNSAHPSALSWANRYRRKWHGRGCVLLCVRMLTMAAATRAIAKTLDDRGWFHYRLYANEKLGGNPPPVRSMDDFHEAISLIDAGFLGSKWTWCNNQEEQACILG